MKNKTKVLLVYISDVSGHRQAAKALKQAFEKEYPEVIVREENLFRHGNPFMGCLLNSLYYAIIKLFPWFWDLIWDSREVYWLTYLLRNVLYRMNYHRFYRKVIKPFDPEIVVCTHSLSCAICSVIKKEKKMNYFLVACPTDFYLNPYWFYKNVDMYFLPQEELKKRYLREKKIPPSKLEVSGIPISPDFSVEKDKDLLRKKWKVKENLYTVLVMGGGQGWGAIQEMVLSLHETGLPLQVIVVTGTNRKLRKNLCCLSSSLNFPFQVHGYVRKIDELMEISDLLITKPGGLTTAEALSKGLPMIVIDSITGQERRNKKMLLEKGFALAIDNTEKLREAVGFFFNNGFDKNMWKKKTREIARPNSSYEIVHKIMSMRKKMER